MLTFLSLWGIIEITYSSLKLHPFVPHKTSQAPYQFVASPLGIEKKGVCRFLFGECEAKGVEVCSFIELRRELKEYGRIKKAVSYENKKAAAVLAAAFKCFYFSSKSSNKSEISNFSELFSSSSSNSSIKLPVSILSSYSML